MRRPDLALAVITGLAHVGCAGLFCIACDGYLGIAGQVVERMTAPPGTHSAVLIDSPEAQPQEGMLPLVDCEVTAQPWNPKTRAKPDTARLWTLRGMTDTEGRFAVGGTAKPGQYDATLSIRCPGFREVQHVFRHDRRTHSVLVILLQDQAAGVAEK